MGCEGEYRCNVMLKAGRSSEEQRQLVDVKMPKFGVAPNVVTYTSLVSMLMIEGDAEAARRVVERDMPAAGVQPNNFTKEALTLPELNLQRMRAARRR